MSLGTLTVPTHLIQLYIFRDAVPARGALFGNWVVVTNGMVPGRLGPRCCAENGQAECWKLFLSELINRLSNEWQVNQKSVNQKTGSESELRREGFPQVAGRIQVMEWGLDVSPAKTTHES